MSKLKCVEHNRRVHVWDDGLGAVTVHRNDGTRCVVNPLVVINEIRYTPSDVVSWDMYTEVRRFCFRYSTKRTK